ncbi:putative monovalent cation/H+ antiporter subunit C [Rickettsia akari str. Hartford]|uniref:Monovalent cation/H+ antiporter subunit C n=1 Tax=Rickettsia akari (strain Hartford) TaxID=293614 RepID=A8GMU2_RICAH|nr:putative monovalent cation/H+ antiporter subunit C [Rickettsia akari str. Hartford]
MLDKMQIVVITRAKVIKRKDIIESKAPNKGNNICMIGKWLAMIIYQN